MDYRSGFQPSGMVCDPTWGCAPGWYSVGPSALRAATVQSVCPVRSFGYGVGLLALIVAAAMMLVGCKSAPTPAKPPVEETSFHYPARPAVPPPAFKVFHQDNDTYTLVTKGNATDDEISALLWQFRDAAHDHAFDALHLSQKFIDARKPTVWLHVYRGAKCASEKYTKGPLPCEAAYHGAGDYTLGDYKNPDWQDGVLHTADGSETHLWDTEKPVGSR
jgi:hypothetical protein